MYIHFNSEGHNVITSDRVHSVMMAVDRGFFISHNPYEDRPQSIGYSATISAPHMVCCNFSSKNVTFKPTYYLCRILYLVHKFLNNH